MANTLLLAGGGHAHRHLLLHRLLKHLPDDRVVLVAPERFVAYGPMLPGLLCGKYRFRECHIDLAHLCERAGVELLYGRIAGIDQAARRAWLDDGRELGFSVASLNTGARPITALPGAEEHALSLFPVQHFLPLWQQLREHLSERTRPLSLGIVGDSSLAIEMALAIQESVQNDRRSSIPVELHLITTGSDLPADTERALQLRVALTLYQQKVRIHTRFPIGTIESDRVLSEHQQLLRLDQVILLNASGGGAWLESSGLTADASGRLTVESTLQVKGCEKLFAVGDVALNPAAPPLSLANASLEQQSQRLAHNLNACLKGEALKSGPFKTARTWVDLGSEQALTHWGQWIFAGPWVRRAKERLARRTMARYPGY
ncbi:FAD-dependent oxidoreductase [Marinimicrobium alkaliphilum]|uniref:FAD-dependent oxidoreductase n=1 Tax=Marinimicrobium alkaliphilum TaxID=2202654 RepID=UPI000DBA82EE|nr:FAD-dependent oxidoreductase [Marinimicrobium alkaliphilum]